MAQTSPNVYQFKISLKGSKPLIWRRIQVPEEYSFFDLHVAIQDAMGWKDYHLHQFSMRNPSTGHEELISTHDENVHGMEIISGKPIKIARYFLTPKAKGNYEYDFGDSWEHSITLEKILPAVSGESYPQCIAGKNAGPPEDCGGVCGYEEILESISDPTHKEHQEHIDWLKQMNWQTVDFDPKRFDPKTVEFRDPEERWKIINGKK